MVQVPSDSWLARVVELPAPRAVELAKAAVELAPSATEDVPPALALVPSADALSPLAVDPMPRATLFLPPDRNRLLGSVAATLPLASLVTALMGPDWAPVLAADPMPAKV